MSRLPVGIIGCGNISRIYAQAGGNFDNLAIVACADLDRSRAEALAQEYGIPKVLEVEELLASPDVALVINLTVPAAHADVAWAALKKGKHVYNEKPLALRRREARDLIGLARDKGLRIGCAPDTFLGAGLQTCRHLIDEGVIGVPVAGSAFMLGSGPESWHPNPAFFYQKGAGPLFDMGPYYLTALTTLLGPVRRVTASARVSFKRREISSQPLAGQMIDVEVPTHVSAVMDFESGPVVTLTTSFDVEASRLPRIEIYGSEGTLSVPDPNTFGGEVWLRRRGDNDWHTVPLEFGYAENSRGLGVADMAAALVSGREHRANERVAYHVLDLMHSIIDASESGRHVEMKSAMVRPAPLPLGLAPGQIDD
ncbi:oxidoreductase [Spartobacteria bacterium LR76]|nr:oxidoreductase [Spartobacteria bacterium LR76]